MTPSVQLVKGRGASIAVTLTDADARTQSIPNGTACVLRAERGDVVITASSTTTAGVVTFVVSASESNKAAGRYVGDVRVDLVVPINTERFYIDLVEPIA